MSNCGCCGRTTTHTSEHRLLIKKNKTVFFNFHSNENRIKSCSAFWKCFIFFFFYLVTHKAATDDDWLMDWLFFVFFLVLEVLYWRLFCHFWKNSYWSDTTAAWRTEAGGRFDPWTPEPRTAQTTKEKTLTNETCQLVSEKGPSSDASGWKKPGGWQKPTCRLNLIKEGRKIVYFLLTFGLFNISNIQIKGLKANHVSYFHNCLPKPFRRGKKKQN